MIIHYLIGTIRWQRYKRESYRPTTGWKCIIETLERHPFLGHKFSTSQQWEREKFVVKLGEVNIDLKSANSRLAANQIDFDLS